MDETERGTRRSTAPGRKTRALDTRALDTRALDTRALGAWGEDLAAQHLRATGLTVLARNWRCREGEIDLVARDPSGALVFVEVKTRRGSGFGDPSDAVTPAKARRLRVLACRWLAAERPAGAAELRFDVVGIVVVPGSSPRVTHLRAAF